MVRKYKSFSQKRPPLLNSEHRDVKCMNLEELTTSLEEIADGELVWVLFKSGEEFELSDCEVVDESIYGNRTTLMANVVKKLAGDERFHKPGTKLEFSAQDIMAANIIATGKVLHETHT